jgi:hypothetical protein
MANTYKSAQVQGTASTSTYATLYSTGASTRSVISTIVICNTAASVATYRIGLTTSAGTPSAAEWLIYDTTIAANDSVCLSLGICMDPSKFLRVSSSAATISFAAFISEIS